jgi:hypothetical protein
MEATMRHASEIPSSERETGQWRTADRLPAVELTPAPLPWSRADRAMAAVAIVCAVIAAAVVVLGILPLLGD